MSSYVILNQQFCDTHAGYTNQTGIFGFRVTTSGQYVASAQTITDFPELFQGELPFAGIIIIELEVSDFPNTSTLP